MSNTTKKHPFDILKEKGLFTPMIVAVAALLIGLLVGVNLGGSDAKSAAAISTPAPTITKTVTETKTVSEVPQECLNALNEADRGFDVASQMMGKYSDGIQQITGGQLDDAYDTIKDIKRLNSKLDGIAPNYNSSKSVCRSAGSTIDS